MSISGLFDTELAFAAKRNKTDYAGVAIKNINSAFISNLLSHGIPYFLEL